MSPGKNAFKSFEFSSGHPIVEKGNSPDENQVSRTSSSYSSVTFDTSTLNFVAATYFASSRFFPTTQ
jgi:hypothetical protein